MFDSLDTLAESLEEVRRSAGQSAGALAGFREALSTASDEDLVAALREADSEIASFDALVDQDVLLAILRLESEPGFERYEPEVARIRKLKETAIGQQDFETAAGFREQERALHREVMTGVRADLPEDSLWRLRLHGLIDVPDAFITGEGYEIPALTDAGRRLAASLL